MPAVKSGRIEKTRRREKSTTHQKNHRWESFSTKVSKLHSLDPLRKVRRHDLDAEDISTATSYLRNGIERWAELNISKAFTSFRREALPLCDSLPQILHHESRIMELLGQYISLQEKESLEPLLDLLTAFAHDLGTRFEKHYPRSLDLIVAIASKPQPVEVIEWTFAALAFLFKYLSRLLVPDLRPTYNVLAPLLGKTRHPQHIARFAAESMSFLVKKAAAPAHREASLPMIVEHARQDLYTVLGTRDFDLYYHGLMTMFAEAIKSSGETLHSTGPHTFSTLMDAIPEEELSSRETSPWADLCCGVLTSVIHHSTPETFGGFEAAVLEHIAKMVDGEEAAEHPWQSSLVIRILATVGGVRKGSRVTNWSGLVQQLSKCLVALSKVPKVVESRSSDVVWQTIIVSTAMVWHHAPMESLIPSISKLKNALTREPLMRWYIPFCAYFSELDSGRFKSLFKNDFQQFIVKHWSEGQNEETLCMVVPTMIQSGGLPSASEKDGIVPKSWQAQIVSKFERLESTPFPERGVYDKDPKTWREHCLPKYSALLQLLECTVVHPSTNARIAELLLRKLKLALRPSNSLATDEALFIVSQGFHAYLRMVEGSGMLDHTLSPLLRAATPRYRRSVGFLKSLLAYEGKLINMEKKDSPIADGSESPAAEENPLVHSLVDNLGSDSHELRLASLQILELLEITSDFESCLATMVQINQTPLTLQNTRNIGTHIRKLGLSYGHLPDKHWLCHAVPAFLFGMLTVNLSPVWNDAVLGLKQIAETTAGEEAVAVLAFDWIAVPSPRWDGSQRQAIENNNRSLTDFECLNIIKLRNNAKEMGKVIDGSAQMMLKKFQDSQDGVTRTWAHSRARALKVLSATPSVAERRSRKLVPYFLAWGGDDTDLPDSRVQEQQDPDLEKGWSLADRKSLLGVFAQFNNPRVLFESQRVYDALLGQLANGDIEVQKLALKAVLAWKQPGVKAYQESLEFLLDEARFPNELTVLFQGDRPIQPDHRPEIVPVLARLLYGRMISKKGVSSGRDGLAAIRKAVIRHLSNADMMGCFLEIALSDLKGVRVVDASGVRENAINRDFITPRKQVGLLNMVDSVITELGINILPFTEPILNAVLYCLFSSCRKLRDTGENEEEITQGNHESLIKVARTTALKCLNGIFQKASLFDWTPYKTAIVAEVISPRIDAVPGETTQGVSWILRLLATWSTISKTALFFSIDSRILPKIVECVGNEKSKAEVKVFALRIVRNLVGLARAPAAESEFNELIQADLLESNVDLILSSINKVLRGPHDPRQELQEACVDTVVEIAPIVGQSENVESLIEISAFLLNQPGGKVKPKVKGNLLLVLEHFIKLDVLRSNGALKDKVFTTLSSLFSYFKDRNNRSTLANVLKVFSQQDLSLQEVSEICSNLNSFVEDRIDLPNYDRRRLAFNTIVEKRHTPFSPQQWLPLLHNLVFFIAKDEEYGILSVHSADCICRFIEAAECEWGQPVWEQYSSMLSSVLLPAIYSGARDPSEKVRLEILRVLGSFAAHLSSWGPVSDLQPLVPASDDSADRAFFFHILRPAVSKQIQALQLLISVNEKTGLSSKNISHFFVPLLEHFIFGRQDGSDDQGLGAQATITIASLARSLEWPQYRTMLRRYISYVESKPEPQKQVMRLLDKVVDTLANAHTQKHEDKMEVDHTAKESAAKCRLAATMPAQEKLSDDVVNNLIPPLLSHLHEKDESTVSARVPVGIIIVKLLRLLPTEQMDAKLPGVLTDISHILRSKAWESREMARDTLAKISTALGPSCFGFLLKELRGALTRGYQLHVLSYTMHSLLLAGIPAFKQGDLDYCLETIVTIVMDDIFGTTGQEKDADEYISKMKEVKSSKSQDSMELIAKNASIDQLFTLVRPLHDLLLEKLDLRIARKIDDLLSRITSGLLQNPAAESRDTLIFCYEVIQKVYAAEKPEEEPKLDPKLKRYLLQKGAKRGAERGSTTKYTHKLVRFSVDVLRSILRKHDSLRTAGNISGFLPLVGDAVVAGDDEVKIAAFKLLTVIVKVPFRNNESTGVYKVSVKEATKAISMAPSTTSDMAQSALKLVSVILRDRREVTIKDAAVDMLLGKLKDDLTEPLYRHVTFNFLRAVLDRKIETAVVYDTMDYVGVVMITNDDKDTRDLARGAFFQFLRDYPQKKSRWAKQLSFIVANLQYDREGGRLSVMEVVHLLLMKSADDFVQEVAATCFIPLVFVLANDESEKCRTAAGELIKEIFRKADKERMQKFLTLLRSWLEQDENKAVLGLALQAFGFYFEAREASSKDKKDVGLLVTTVMEVLVDLDESDDELIHSSLVVVQTLLEKHPSNIFSDGCKSLWERIWICLTYQDGPVQLSAIRLASRYLADFASNAVEASVSPPLQGSHGLVLEKAGIFELTRHTLDVLTSPAVDEALAEEVVRVLVFLGDFLDSASSKAGEEASDVEDEEEDVEDGWGGIEDEPQETNLQFVFRKLASILRREVPPTGSALTPKLAAMDVLEAFAHRLPRSTLQAQLRTMLTPLHHLTDPSIPTPFSTDLLFRERAETLRTRATAVMDLLQRKLGTADYTAQLLKVTEGVRGRRQQRSSKRKVEAMTQPERYGREKRKRFEKKRMRRKTKGMQHRSMRRGF